MKGGIMMKKNPILTIVLAILIIQPFLIFGLGPSTLLNTTEPTESKTISQGVRLDSDDLVSHVPFTIDEDDDFVSQGWPGSGTAGDPYVISGLNITYDVGLYAIEILNITKHFIIEDCYIGQGSAKYGIYIEDVPSCTIQYNTIESHGGGIYLWNANSTDLSHNIVACVGSVTQYTVYGENSFDWKVENNIFNSTFYRSFRIVDVHNTEVFNCFVKSSPTRWGLHLISCNNSLIHNNTIYDSSEGLSLVDCYDSEVYDISIHDAGNGIAAISSKDISIMNIVSRNLNDHGAYIDAVDEISLQYLDLESTSGGDPGIYISNSNVSQLADVIIASDGRGIYLSDVHNIPLENITITKCNTDAVYVVNSDNLTLTDITIVEALNDGIDFRNSQRPVLSNIVMNDIGYDGFYFQDCDNGSLIHVEMTNVVENGIYFDDCDNWMVSDVSLSECGGMGFYIGGGHNSTFTHNYLELVEDEAFNFNTHDDPNVIGNTVVESGYGIYFTTCNRVGVWDNEVYMIESDGMHFDSAVNGTIAGNNLTMIGERGINLYDFHNATFWENTITDTEQGGITVSMCEFLNFTENAMTNCGFFFPETSNVNENNHTMVDNEVNDLPVYYGLAENGQTITGNDYGQIILVDCEDMTIDGGTFVGAGNIISHCEDVYAEGLTFEHGWFPWYVFYSDWVEINASTFSHTMDSYMVAYSYCENGSVSNSIFDRGHYGIYLYYTDTFTVEDSHFEYLYRGVYADGDPDNLTVSGCDFWHMEMDAIYSLYGEYGLISGCYFYNISNYAVYNREGHGWEVSSNIVRHAGYAYRGDTDPGENGTVQYNEFYSCARGIYVDHGDYYWARNNTILYSKIDGIRLYDVDNANVYYNILGLSTDHNGYDNNLNTWDDGVDTGNWWSDYTGPGVYNVPGGVSVDNYPMQYLPESPIINNQLDVYYAEGSTGNYVEWLPYDNALSHFEARIDGDLWAADAWNFTSIKINIDGLPYGQHLLSLIVWDVDQNNVTDDLFINVYDDKDPTINNPPNKEIFVDGTGQTLSWIARDLNPGEYVVYRNETEYDTGTWEDNVTISVNVDGLSVGVYAMRMVVYDLDDNYIGDTVLILVIDDADNPTIDSPDDITMIAGTTGNRIVWTPTDEYPDSYEIELNNSVIESDSWGGGRIVYSLDNLPVGTHTFKVTVFDMSGGTVDDTVTVVVLPKVAITPPPPPLDLTMFLIIGGVAVAAIAVIGGIYFFRKRRAV